MTSDEFYSAFDTGIEVLVMLQHGAAPILEELSCNNCSADDCTMNGCALQGDKDGNLPEATSPIYLEVTTTEYFHCPISLIPSIVYAMNDKYQFIKEFNSSINEETCPKLFWYFVKTYKQTVQRIKSAMQQAKTT